jgi:hypothetical protein
LLLPASGPNFYKFSDEVLYQIKIDNDGDAIADVSYQFDFNTDIQNDDTFLYNTGEVSSLDDENLNVRQTYTLTRVEEGDAGDHEEDEAGGDDDEGLITGLVQLVEVLGGDGDVRSPGPGRGGFEQPEDVADIAAFMRWVFLTPSAPTFSELVSGSHHDNPRQAPAE